MKQLIKFSTIIISLTCLFMAGAFIGSTAGFDPVGSGLVLSVGFPTVVVAVKYCYKLLAPEVNTSAINAVFVGVNKEVWLDVIMENFYPDGAWIKRARDLSAFVENDVINLADCGADPDVLVNHTGLVGIVARVDNPLALTLDTLDSVNTPVKNVEQIEAAYDKITSVVDSHKLKIQSTHYERAAYNFTPSTNTANTPVINATGDVDGVTGVRALRLKDIIALQTRFNKLRLPKQNRVLVLCSDHLADILTESEQLNNQYVNLVEGKALRYAGFDIYQDDYSILFSKIAIPVKQPYGTAYVPASHTNKVSFAFQGGEVGNADGTLKMYYLADDPQYRADIIGFQKRSLGIPMRGKGIAALVSTI